MKISTVLVVGAGTMGRGIASLCATRGFRVRLTDADEHALAAAREAIAASWEKLRAKGKLSEVDVAAASERLTAESLEADDAAADLAIEAVPERLDLKRDIFLGLEGRLSESAILATNTSSLSITKIAATLRHPERVIGLHFFNPAPVMPLLEIVVGTKTSPATLASAREFAEALGKRAITVKDSPGFATSRLGVALGLEAIRMLEEGVASAEDIDAAMEAGYGHAMGPLRTSDLVGLDVRLAIAEALARDLPSSRFEPPALLRRMVAEGKTGVKAGEGFFRWKDRG
jgi:3-hydroxybutyryl-CoA dehydrogenase